MAKNYIQPGEKLELTAPTGGVVGGSGYLIGALFVVADADVDEGDPFIGHRCGVWDLTKTSAQAWTEGQKVYWDDSASEVTTDGTKGQLIGVAAAAAANPTSTGSVLLNGTSPSALEGAQAAIADLVAITGGDAPTEAEHNAIVTAFNTLLAELRIAGVIASS